MPANLLPFLMIFGGFLLAGTAIHADRRRTRNDRAWQEWHQQQRERLFAWRLSFVRPKVRRLTYRPEKDRDGS